MSKSTSKTSKKENIKTKPTSELAHIKNSQQIKVETRAKKKKK
jgi:hypothetical protein